mmetsp:Transcript_147726/g.411419  ORF Transcript_147726/g.411419 Transcript_147726/m.411419 type:complete len:117 (+) Transcript_147726:78-428(+)
MTLFRALALLSAGCLVVLSLSGCGACTIENVPGAALGGEDKDLTCTFKGFSSGCCDAAKKQFACQKDVLDAAKKDPAKAATGAADIAKCLEESADACSSDADKEAQKKVDTESACK